MAELLQLVSWDVMPQILQILKSHWPDTMASYYTLMLSDIWRQDQTLHQDFLLMTPGGKVDEYGTFVLINPTRWNIVFDSLNPDTTRIKSLLLNCKEINREVVHIYGPFHARFTSIMEELLTELKLSRYCQDSIGELYFMDLEKAKKLTYECPEEVFVAPLREEHATLINSVWPHRDGDRSIPDICQLITVNGGIGIFIKDTEELAAWGLQCWYGGPGLVQTQQQFQRKGYGHLAAIAITNYVADKGWHPQLYIMTHNTPSQKLFLGLGYTKACGVNWITLTREHPK